ncbi:MAG: hypothetical protein ACYDGR_05060 [Candidatus Dormibacteria bacterium]
MRGLPGLVLIAALSASALVPAQVLAAPPSATQGYVGIVGEACCPTLLDQAPGGLPAVASCGSSSAPSTYAACFLVKAGTVDIVVKDSVASQVGAQWTFRNDSGTSLGNARTRFCTHTEKVKVPDGATQLLVSVGIGMFQGVPPVWACGSPAPGTAGSITVSGAVRTPSQPVPVEQVGLTAVAPVGRQHRQASSARPQVRGHRGGRLRLL